MATARLTILRIGSRKYPDEANEEVLYVIDLKDDYLKDLILLDSLNLLRSLKEKNLQELQNNLFAIKKHTPPSRYTL